MKGLTLARHEPVLVRVQFGPRFLFLQRKLAEIDVTADYRCEIAVTSFARGMSEVDETDQSVGPTRLIGYSQSA